MILVTAKQMQQMDHNTINEFGIPGLVLMENAGRGAVEILTQTFDPIEDKQVAIIAGRGNNGGDGFVIGRYLMEMGVHTSFFLLSTRDRVTGDALTNMALVERLLPEHPYSSMVEVPDAKAFDQYRTKMLHHDIFVDAILGTGLNSNVRGVFKNVIQALNQTGKPIFSVDIPSGINSDTGDICGTAIQADATATFGFAKAGHFLQPGSQYTGNLDIVDIGIPWHIAQAQRPDLYLPEPEDITDLFSPRPIDSHKGSFGHLLALAGSPGKTGAGALCANAAQRCGTGLVTLGVAQGLNPVMEPLVTEPMTIGLPETATGGLSIKALALVKEILTDKNALALGPGLGTDSDTKELVRELVAACRVPMVIDADGLNCLADDPNILTRAQAPVILTPHPGEMARLTGKTTAQVQADRLGIARQFARDFNVILVLKGSQTLVCCPDNTSYICPTGNPGMASGGMGDVLTGMIAGFAAQGLNPEAATLAGVFIHGLCGDILARNTPVGFLATDVVTTIPIALGEILP